MIIKKTWFICMTKLIASIEITGHEGECTTNCENPSDDIRSDVPWFVTLRIEKETHLKVGY